MISFAPNDASSDNAPCGSSLASPPASNPSIFASISADGGTVPPTAQASFNRLAGLEGTYAVALTATDLQQLGDTTGLPPGRVDPQRWVWARQGDRRGRAAASPPGLPGVHLLVPGTQGHPATGHGLAAAGSWHVGAGGPLPAPTVVV